MNEKRPKYQKEKKSDIIARQEAELDKGVKEVAIAFYNILSSRNRERESPCVMRITKGKSFEALDLLDRSKMYKLSKDVIELVKANPELFK